MDIYTPEELAERWKCSAVTVYRMLNAGTLAGFRLGKAWRIRETEIIEYEKPHTTNLKED